MAALDEKLDLAEVVYDELDAVESLEVPWRPELSLVAFRPKDPTREAKELLDRINSSGRVWLSSARFRGHDYLRDLHPFSPLPPRPHPRRSSEGPPASAKHLPGRPWTCVRSRHRLDPMVLMALLVAVMLLGLVATWRWGALDLVVPWEPASEPLPVSVMLQRYIWFVTVGLASGIVAGVVMLGAGGRLAMRLLAVTAGPDAQGVITEAEETVGEITLGGTLGFIGFFGIAVGTVLAFAFMLIRRWLPRGRGSGATFGILLLLVLATRADPLRPENPDFDLVGPDWVAVLAFCAIVVGYGVLLGAMVGRFSRFLPLLKRDVRTIAKYVPPYVVFGPAFVILGIPLIIVGALAVLAGRVRGLEELWHSERVSLAGRALLVLIAAIAAPGFFIGVADILGSG